MELRQLEYFVAVAEERHFGRAAARCDVVTSALSTSVQKLETELGVPLLRRTTRSVSVTEAGTVFLPEARRCLTAASGARAAVGALAGLSTGLLRIGGIPTFGLLDQPALLSRLRHEYPGLTVRYTRGTSTDLLGKVRAGQLDVAVLSLPDPAPADLTMLQLATGQVLIACAPEHRLAGRRTVGPDELAAEDFVAPPPGSRGRDYIDQIFSKAGVAPNIPHEVDDAAAMLDFVEAGLGVALVIEPIAASRPALHTLTIAEPSFTWTVAVLAPPADQLSPAARAVLDMISTARPGPPPRTAPPGRADGSA